MDFSKYTSYSFEDFLNNDEFVAFVVEQNPFDIEAWDRFKNDNPQRRKVAEAAFNTIISYRNQKVFYNQTAQAKVFDRISKSISVNNPKPKIFGLASYLKIAAVFVLVFLSFMVYRTLTANQIQKTDFGKIRTIVLPDGSEVTLNGNSEIKYAKNFEGGAREVWITGEALFKVKHLNIDTNNIKPEEKFIVHCSDINIEVLGTTFNVRNRHERTTVGLLSGKIRIDYTDVAKVKKQFVMAPGDFVKHIEGTSLTHQKLSNTEHLTAWVNHQLVFKNATIEDMCLVLEDDFGYQIKVEQGLKKLKIEGEINVNNVTDLLHILDTTLHLNIETTNKNITIKQ
ncbi:FecR family protein [Pedobacter aquatilis]|uniref:FecR family protein n=1 Tax=Pedobacter aquatilis TaxID=351343 RepID=UPI00292E9DCA|nr:FecR family protein [Pedobacter aquatilis]